MAIADFKITGDKVRTFIELAILEFQIETNYLLDKLELEYAKLRSQGYSKAESEVIIKKMLVGGEGVVGVWHNRIGRITAELTKQMVSKPAEEYGKMNPKTKFAWVLGSVKTSHCPSCIKLSAMKPRTLKDWRNIGYGLPREGKTDCNVGCRCMLTPR